MDIWDKLEQEDKAIEPDGCYCSLSGCLIMWLSLVIVALLLFFR